MSEHNITVAGGTSTRLKTAGKYCDRDIIVTATGGSGESDPYFLFPYVKSIHMADLDVFNASELVITSNSLTSLTQFADGATNTKVTSITLDTPKASTLGYAFYNQSKITNISFANGLTVGNAASAFYKCSNLTTITGTLNLNGTSSGAYNNIFTGCTELKTVTFEIECLKTSISFADCAKLSGRSITSIVNGLANLTGSTEQKTITLNEQLDKETYPTYGQLTTYMKTAITDKNWILVLST